MTLDRSRDSPLDVTSRGVAALPHPQKRTEGNQQPHDLLHSRRQLKAIGRATQDFILAHLCSNEKARELRDLNAEFPCIPDLETFRSVLDNKTWLDRGGLKREKTTMRLVLWTVRTGVWLCGQTSVFFYKTQKVLALYTHVWLSLDCSLCSGNRAGSDVSSTGCDSGQICHPSLYSNWYWIWRDFSKAHCVIQLNVAGSDVWQLLLYK